MSFNSDLYKAIQSGGLNLSSPSIIVGNSAIAKLDELNLALDNPQLELLMVDPLLIESTKTAVENAKTSASGSVGHMSKIANEALQISSATKAVNTLDAKVDGVAAGCSNTTNVFGSIQGESDADFDELAATAEELIVGIDDFIATQIELDVFEQLMRDISARLATTIAKVATLINKEQVQYTDVVGKLQSLSQSQQVDRLWQDPCTKAVMETVLPDELKDLLT